MDEAAVYDLGPLLWKKVQEKEEGKKDNKDCENHLLDGPSLSLQKAGLRHSAP